MLPAVPALAGTPDDNPVPICIREFDHIASEFMLRWEVLRHAKVEGGATLMKWAFNHRIVIGACEFLAREGWSPVTQGSREQPRTHPAIKVLTDALEAIERADAALLELLADPMRPSFTAWDKFDPDSRPRFE